MSRPVITDLNDVERFCKSKGFDCYTDLQENAFLSDAFYSHKDVFVIGETSSGKTLIAQTAIAMTPHQKTLYLVPYRSLAWQKAQEMRYLFDDLEVLVSTAEHRENDEKVRTGQADIVVIIYEKAFIFSAFDAGFLDKYEIIVFDEFGLINDEERGIKADLLFWEVKNHPGLRTVVLATPNYDWSLYADPNRFLIIKSKNRPVDLVKTDIIRKELQKDPAAKIREAYDKNAVKPVPRYMVQLRGDVPSIDFGGVSGSFDDLLTHICASHIKMGHKILIFENGRTGVVDMAKMLYQNLTGMDIIEIPEEKKVTQLKRSMLERMQILEENLHLVFTNDCFSMMAGGISFHSASLPFELRREIENEFLNDNGILSVVCATETLAFGINSGTDVVVVASIFKHGSGKQTTITKNEYLNYLGRAGRYGQREKGYTYTFILSRHLAFWDEMLSQDAIIIESKLYSKDPKDAAMYLLLFMPAISGSMTVSQIKSKLCSLFDHEHSDHTAYWDSIDEQCRLLEERKLIERDDSTFETAYAITDKGQRIKGYVVSMDTYDILCKTVSIVSSANETIRYFDYCYKIAECKYLLEDNDVLFYDKNEQERRITLHDYFNKLEKVLSERHHIGNLLKQDLYRSRGNMSYHKSTQLRIAMILYLRIHAYTVEDIANSCQVGYAAMKRLGEQASYYSDIVRAACLGGAYQQIVDNRLKMLSLSFFYGLHINSLGICDTDAIGAANYKQINLLAKCFELAEKARSPKDQYCAKLARLKLRYDFENLPESMQTIFRKGYGELL